MESPTEGHAHSKGILHLNPKADLPPQIINNRSIWKIIIQETAGVPFAGFINRMVPVNDRIVNSKLKEI